MCIYQDMRIMHTLLDVEHTSAMIFISRTSYLEGMVDHLLTQYAVEVTKFSFLVEVESSDDVKLDPVEHVAFMWVTEDEARNKKCGDVEFKYTMPRQMQVVLKAFEMKKQEGQSAENV